ncbi:lasso RiPP family leader peptide-containing protein [Dyadobacter sp. CY347]|uniref:lasso RiPP family leader peptide-containing protein n=1 Tax=Dyadobacter sp. CY347 TaxID=2909336 RepID=UPI001F16EEAF|nr:lasso RiPP family leader peptide-containing protein [Dyadobacter sp. CY347]MCF2491178.1 lasso RiPP family leader peptide-containing protein [Dyadobacter sp. CY347]
MKTVQTHSTQTKKMYNQPVLEKLGSVTKLTKGKLGSAFDGVGNPFEFDGEG